MLAVDTTLETEINGAWIIILSVDSFHQTDKVEQSYLYPALFIPAIRNESPKNTEPGQHVLKFHLPDPPVPKWTNATTLFCQKPPFVSSVHELHTKIILQAGSADGRGLVLRALQVCASIPGQQGGACAQHSHLRRGSGWLTFHLGSRRLGGLAERLLKTVGGEGRRGGGEKRRRPEWAWNCWCYCSPAQRVGGQLQTWWRDIRRNDEHADATVEELVHIYVSNVSNNFVVKM